MTARSPVRVVVAAGGLGTRVHRWSRYLPKEFLPVDGQPAIVHLIEEISALARLAGGAHVVIVHHPYYEVFTAWARQALSPYGQTRYHRATGTTPPCPLPADVTIDFIAQHGPYADLTSLLNGTDHLTSQGTPATDTYLIFADNLYQPATPLLGLHALPDGQVAILASPYNRTQAPSRGVIVTAPTDSPTPQCRQVTDILEKPTPTAAIDLETSYGTDSLYLLEGRAKLSEEFTNFTRTHLAQATHLQSGEAKLALALKHYATTHAVLVLPTLTQIIDLGQSRTD